MGTIVCLVRSSHLYTNKNNLKWQSNKSCDYQNKNGNWLSLAVYFELRLKLWPIQYRFGIGNITVWVSRLCACMWNRYVFIMSSIPHMKQNADSLWPWRYTALLINFQLFLFFSYTVSHSKSQTKCVARFSYVLPAKIEANVVSFQHTMFNSPVSNSMLEPMHVCVRSIITMLPLPLLLEYLLQNYCAIICIWHVVPATACDLNTEERKKQLIEWLTM